MNRAEELQAIDEHIQIQGAYQCRMGECHYGDEGPSFRERMANIAKNMKKLKASANNICEHCKVTFHTKASRKSKYCSRKCYGAATKGVFRGPYTGQEIIIDGKRYRSQVAAANALGISTSGIQRRIKSGRAQRTSETDPAFRALCDRLAGVVQ